MREHIRCLTCGGAGFFVVHDPSEMIAMTILLDVAHEYRVPVKAMQEQDRHAHIVRARHEAMARLSGAGFTLKEIGWYLGKRHYSTVIHGLRKVEREAQQ